MLKLVLCCLIVLCVHSIAQQFPYDGDVLVLTDNTINSAIK